MTMHAGWPFWMTFVLFFAVMGPMMRMIFGGRFPHEYRGKRLKRRNSEDVTRMEDALLERDEVIEDLQRRLSEMESRLDFTERMLARAPATAGPAATEREQAMTG